MEKHFKGMKNYETEMKKVSCALSFGAEAIMERIIEQPVTLAPHPLLVTPAGIARNLWREQHGR